MPELWEVHALRSEDGPSSGFRFLDLEVFNSFYAAMLFATFDSDNSGFLSLDQATRALDFLQLNAAGSVAYAFPADDDAGPNAVRLGADWFWSVFQRMK